MTNYVGLTILTLRGPGANSRSVGAQSSRRELPEGTCASARRAAERRSAGASGTRDGRPRCSANGRKDASLSAEPQLLCAHRAGRLSQASRRRGGRARGADRAGEKTATTRRQATVNLTAVMKTIGFRRTRNHYEHPRTAFFVEFPAGPLGIGADTDVRPVVYKIGGIDVRALSATDACRDRLAAFYHWNDRQSLNTAVQIARHRKVDLEVIRASSRREGALEGFSEFFESLGQSPRAGPRAGKPLRFSSRRSSRT